MAQVIRTSPVSATRVKNLGWLLHHWADVESFTFAPSTTGGRGRTVPDLILIAHLRSGGVYLTHYASLNVCLDFLHRPVFYGLPVLNLLPTQPGAYNMNERFILRRA